jgi:hypothetical protein
LLAFNSFFPEDCHREKERIKMQRKGLGMRREREREREREYEGGGNKLFSESTFGSEIIFSKPYPCC